MKIKSILLPFLLVNLFLLSNFVSYGQENEAELKSKAEKSYKDENFVEATKLYSSLLAFNPRDAFYNYRYGVCLIYNSRKKIEAIKHLTYASKEENFDPEVFYYLGKAYHLNYEFGEAIKNYNLYKEKIGSKINHDLDVNRQIEMSENGKRLLSSANEIVVLDKKEIESGNFFRIYDLKNIGGDILVNAQFQSKIDKKNKHTPIIHFPANPSIIYYSSYGEDESNGKDIYIRQKLPNGAWSLPQTVNGGVNTKYDEDFPYMHPNGKYLYFCSKGHNSMGGYDVFRCPYDKASNSFGKAENLDFTVSSPDNDLFYIVDSLDKNAYFASARQSLDGKIHVYKVRVEQVPIQLAVIKANFVSTINPENKKVAVEIMDFASNTKIGTFNAGEKGNVLMTFPKGGKYEYLIKVDGSSTIFKSVVNVPFLKEFKPLKQKLIHEIVDGVENVRVVNLFDENVEDQVATLAEIARQRSELNPNSDQFDLNKLDKGNENKSIYAEIGYSKMSDKEVQDNIEKLASNQEKQTQNLVAVQQKAVDKVIENIKEQSILQNDLKKVVADAESKTGEDKKNKFKEAVAIVNELNKLDSENKKLIAFADSVKKEIPKSKEQEISARKMANEINKAFQENNPSLAAEKIKENKTKILELQKENTDLASQEVVKEIIAKRDEVRKLTAKQKEFEDIKSKAKEDLINLDIQLAEAKNKDKAAIQKKISDKEEEIKMADEELKPITPKLETKKTELKKLESQLGFVQDILNSKSPATNTSIEDASKQIISSETQNTRTLKSYVEEQSKQLGFDMASQRMPEKVDESSKNFSLKEMNPSQKELASQMSNDYFKNLEAIAKDEKLSDEQKLVYSQKENKQLKYQLAKEINTVQEALKQNPNDASLKSKMDELTKLNDLLKNNIEAQQNTLNSKYPENHPKKMISEMQLANRIKPNHFAVLSSIEDQSETMDNKTLDKAQKEDQEFIRLLSKEKVKNEEILKQNPTDETAIHELGLIKKLLADTDKRIEKRTMGMASFQVPENKTDNTYIPENKANVTENKTSNSENSNTKENKTTSNQTEDNKTNVTENKTNSTENSNAKENKTTLNQTEENKTNVTENKTISSENSNAKENKTTSNQTEENKTNVTENKTISSENSNAKENKTTSNQTEENKTNVTENKTNNSENSNSKENKTTSNQTEENKTNISENNQVKDVKTIQELVPNYEKSVSSIQNNKSTETKDKQEKLIIEENKLQTAVDKKLLDLEKQITSNPSDTSLISKKQKLIAVKTQSENREKESKELIVSDYKSKIDTNSLKKSIDKTYEIDINASNSEEKIKREEEFQSKVQSKIAANEKRISANENLQLIAENQVLNEIFETSKSKVETLKNPILVNKENGTNSTNKINSEENTTKKNEIVALEIQEETLENQLNDPKISKEQKKQIQSELLKIEEKQIEIFNSSTDLQAKNVTKPNIEDAKSTQKTDLNILALDTISYSQVIQNEKDILELKKDLAKTKKESKKLEILQEITEKQSENFNLYSEILYNKQQRADLKEIQTFDSKSTALTLESKETLELRKKSNTSEIEELKEIIESDKIKLKDAKSDEKLILAKRIVSNEKKIELLKKEAKNIEEEIKSRTLEVNKNSEKPTNSVSYTEEEKKELSAISNYEDLKILYQNTQNLSKEKNSIFKQLEQAKTQYNKALSDYAQNPSEENKIKVSKSFEDIKRLTREYKEINSKQVEAFAAYQNASKDQNNLAKLEKLFEDGVNSNYVPENNIASTKEEKSEIIPFEILEIPQTTSASERIVVTEEMPMGLIYRVQVGAFRKPLKDKMYAEFKPVSGEQIKDGITRYITGYFGTFTNATQAKKAIRKIGYKDAFVVAYCDGKRISISKAKKLQASGQCVPNPEILTDQIAEFKANKENKSTNNKENNSTKVNSSKEIKPEVTNKSNVKTDYNKAEGAVKAIAVETKLGLFYTVQIGAYRKPATAKQLKYVDNVVSKLLPDGMIRYSTGIFQSVEACMKTKNDAISKGITDAFITAYYNGERISLAEATRLLKEKGDGILEKP